MKNDGFTLIECLVGLALSLFVITAGFEFFVRAQKVFTRLKDREEAGQAALAALDRMRIDLLHAGRGLSSEIGLGLVAAAEASADELRTTSLEKELRLSAEAHAGDTRLFLVSTTDVAAGQRLTLREGPAGEARAIVRVEARAVVIDASLVRDYAPATATLSLLELVSYFVDRPSRILRRRVNTASAQPILENTAAAAWSLDPIAPLVRIRLAIGVEGVHPHEATIFLKNPALAANTGT
jgi:prepilin-type N-terminal cleavage/methylation domain-containing protein